jgi:hypothetical protein
MRRRESRIALRIDPDHWPWLIRHARRLGYFGVADYLNAILNTALLGEREANGETLPGREAETCSDDYEDGLPL